MDYAALKSEITNDPLMLGYSGKTDSDTADLLNTVPGTATNGRQMDRSTIATWEVLEATDPTEWSALGASEKQRYQVIVSAGTINVKGPNVRAAFGTMFGAQSLSRASLLALQTRAASRAEVLFGIRAEIWDVARARAL